MSEPLDVLRGYETWEAKLISEGRWEATGDGLPTLTQELYDDLMALQGRRNDILRSEPSQSPSTGGDRERFARIIDPEAWETIDGHRFSIENLTGGAMPALCAELRAPHVRAVADLSRDSLSKADQIIAALGGEGGGWRPIKDTPKVGGTYVVGGYVNSPVGRYFERDFATLIRTIDGPSWSLRGAASLPIQYWFDLPNHPEAPAPTEGR